MFLWQIRLAHTVENGCATSHDAAVVEGFDSHPTTRFGTWTFCSCWCISCMVVLGCGDGTSNIAVRVGLAMG